MVLQPNVLHLIDCGTLVVTCCFKLRCSLFFLYGAKSIQGSSHYIQTRVYTGYFWAGWDYAVTFQCIAFAGCSSTLKMNWNSGVLSHKILRATSYSSAFCGRVCTGLRVQRILFILLIATDLWIQIDMDDHARTCSWYRGRKAQSLRKPRHSGQWQVGELRMSQFSEFRVYLYYYDTRACQHRCVLTLRIRPTTLLY